MTILIDGYNLLKHIFGSSHVSHVERTKFIAEIAAYIKNRPFQAFIIFDGGQTSYPDISTHGALTVVFSSHKQSADDYIVHYAATHKEHEILVVTDDRQLRDLVTQHQKHTLNTYDFYHHYVKSSPEKTKQKNGHESAIVKTTAQESPELDALMQEASRTLVYKTEDEQPQKAVRAQGSKKERVRARVLDKLRRSH